MQHIQLVRQAIVSASSIYNALECPNSLFDLYKSRDLRVQKSLGKGKEGEVFSLKEHRKAVLSNLLHFSGEIVIKIFQKKKNFQKYDTKVTYNSDTQKNQLVNYCSAGFIMNAVMGTLLCSASESPFCPHFLRYFGSYIDPQGTAYSFMEKAEGDLESYLRLEPEITEKQLKSIAFMVIYSIYYMQLHYKVVHHDLHMKNIFYVRSATVVKKANANQSGYIVYKIKGKTFVIKDPGIIIKIGDFGFARAEVAVNDGPLSTLGISQSFVINEVLQNKFGGIKVYRDKKHKINKSVSLPVAKNWGRWSADFDGSYDLQTFAVNFNSQVNQRMKASRVSYLFPNQLLKLIGGTYANVSGSKFIDDKGTKRRVYFEKTLRPIDPSSHSPENVLLDQHFQEFSIENNERWSDISKWKNEIALVISDI